MPVSGKVLEVNPALITNPEGVNKDPYGQGWMIKISLADKSQLNNLLNVADYKTLIGH